MKIAPKTKYEALASRDRTRPVFASLYLRVEGENDDRRGFVEGTDSYKLGRIPVDLDEGDTEGFVPVEAFKTARKLRADTIRCGDSVDVVTGVTTAVSFPRENPGQWPNTEQLLDVAPGRVDGEVFTVGLNVKLLGELAQGMGCESVTLTFGAGAAKDSDAPSNLRAITVRPLDVPKASAENPEAVGLIMPIRPR